MILILANEGFNIDITRSRVFKTQQRARLFVKAQHERDWDEAKNDMVLGCEVEEYLMYRVDKDNGELELIDTYSLMAGKNGFAIGWESKK